MSNNTQARLYTSENNGSLPVTTSDQGIIARTDADERTEPVAVALNDANRSSTPWVPPEYQIFRGKDGRWAVTPTAVAIAALAADAAAITSQPDFEFAKGSQEADLIQNIGDGIRLHLENDTAVSEYWAKETVRFECQRGAYNAAFAAKQMLDATSRFERVSRQSNDAALDETFQNLWANYLRAGREAKLQILAVIQAVDKPEFDFAYAAKRVLDNQAKYWATRVNEQVSETAAVEQSNAGTLALIRARAAQRAA
jgi:hypothetical protein